MRRGEYNGASSGDRGLSGPATVAGALAGYDMSAQQHLAKRLGISQATISRVLNHPEMVRPETRARVVEAMRELNYERNELPQRLRAGGLDMVGICISGIQNEFFVSMIHGIDLAVSERDWATVLRFTHDHLESERRIVGEMRALRFGGLILLPQEENRELYASLESKRFPFVFIDHTVEGVDAPRVATDEKLGGRLSAEHVLDLGHRRIGRIYGPQEVQSFAERTAGALQAIAERGIPMDPRWSVPAFQMTAEQRARRRSREPLRIVAKEIRQVTRHRVAEGRAAMARLLDLPEGLRPTAVLCENDLLATGAQREAMARGLDVPGEVSIVGYAGFSLTEFLPVPLTTVRQPAHEIGVAAVEALFGLRAGDAGARENRLLPPELKVRASTGPVPD